MSPSEARLTSDGKTRMFRRVFFNVFVCFLGVCFWGCCAYFPYLVGSVELFVVFFVFNLKYIGVCEIKYHLKIFCFGNQVI